MAQHRGVERLVVQPFGGLCNRLRAVVSAGMLAESLDRELEVDWVPDAFCGCVPGDLFRAFPPSHAPSKAAVFHEVGTLRDVERVSAGSPATVRLRLQGELRPDGLDPSVYETRFRDALNALEPLDRILELVPRLPPGTIGMHVRRGDHWPATRYSPLHLFRDVLREGGDGPCYLATDSDGVKAALSRDHAARLPWLRTHASGRSSAAGVGEALADLIALSRTERVYGSMASSFSALASRLGGVPLHTVVLPGAPASFGGDALDHLHHRFLRHDHATGQWTPREPASWRGRALDPVRRPVARALARRAAYVLSAEYQDGPLPGSRMSR